MILYRINFNACANELNILQIFHKFKLFRSRQVRISSGGLFPASVTTATTGSLVRERFRSVRRGRRRSRMHVRALFAPVHYRELRLPPL